MSPFYSTKRLYFLRSAIVQESTVILKHQMKMLQGNITHKKLDSQKCKCLCSGHGKVCLDLQEIRTIIASLFQEDMCLWNIVLAWKYVPFVFHLVKRTNWHDLTSQKRNCEYEKQTKKQQPCY